MREIVTHLDLNASPQQVWRVLTDLPRYAEWNPMMKQASGELTRGAFIRLLVEAPGLITSTVEAKVLNVDEPYELRWQGRTIAPHVLDGEHWFGLQALSATTCRLTHGERFSGVLVPLIARWMIPSMTRAFEQVNAAVARRVEGRSGVSTGST